MDTVYLETTFVGHLAGRTHPDPVVAARQTTTRTWWASESKRYSLYVSRLVLDECSGGDVSAAAERLQEVQSIDLLAATTEVDALASALMRGRRFPPQNHGTPFMLPLLLFTELMGTDDVS